MSTIIVAYFEDADQVNQACQALHSRGLTGNDYARYYFNPPGEHGLYYFGGDVTADEGASGAGKEAAKGATVGGAAGMVAGAVGGPVGALVGAGAGAYMGSLVGAMSGLEDADPDKATTEHPVEPPAGPVLAVNVDGEIGVDETVQLLRSRAARRIDLATGRWSGGEWTDFDPRNPVETVYQQKNDASS